MLHGNFPVAKQIILTVQGMATACIHLNIFNKCKQIAIV